MPRAMADLSDGVRRRAALVVGLVVAAYAVGALAGWRGTAVGDYASNLGTAGAAAIAAATCLSTAVRSSGRSRAAWLLIGAGALSWSVGQGVWSYYELAADRPSPFPSAADAG